MEENLYKEVIAYDGFAIKANNPDEQSQADLLQQIIDKNPEIVVSVINKATDRMLKDMGLGTDLNDPAKERLFRSVPRTIEWYRANNNIGWPCTGGSDA